MLSYCTYTDYQTVAPLSHSSLVPRPPPSLPPFVFTIIHGSDLPLLCIIVNVKGSQKWGRPGNKASHTLYPSFFIFALLFLYSLSPIHGQTLVL